MLLKKGSTVQEFETQFKKNRLRIMRSAKESQAQLDTTKASLEATGLVNLIPHARTTSISEHWVNFTMDGDNVENRRIVHPIVANSGLEWKPTWGARIVEWSEWENGRNRYYDKLCRTCHLDARHDLGNGDRVYYRIEYGDGPELQDGDKLPSGCVISTELEASVSRRAVSCRTK